MLDVFKTTELKDISVLLEKESSSDPPKGKNEIFLHKTKIYYNSHKEVFPDNNSEYCTNSDLYVSKEGKIILLHKISK